MTEPTIVFKQYLINIELGKNGDFLRKAVQLLSQMLMDLEVGQQVGVDKQRRKSFQYKHQMRDGPRR